MTTPIVLATINARYYHASFGLRYLYANLGNLQQQTTLREFTLENRAADIVESLLQEQPTIIGLGVYIWNVSLTTEVAGLLKQVAPDVILILGGPEVGCAEDLPEIASRADYVITGQADLALEQLCSEILDGDPPENRLIEAQPPNLSDLQLPYREYSSEDINHRLIYVEASRGCPFKCEFCLSSLDKTAWPFDLDRFLDEMQGLYERGVRHFKFVDRTFNLKVATTSRILEFFLDKNDKDLFLHFELIPDRLPNALKDYLVRFMPGTLQFEIGVQTFNPEVQTLISRKQNNDKTCENLKWIVEHTHAHVHADLIFGLPGETLSSFATGFNRLHQLGVHEIQFGILKRLRGTPICRHEESFQLKFNPAPPYEILQNRDIDFATTQRMQRFARYWDMIANSGRFKQAISLFSEEQLFEQFDKLSVWLYQTTGQTHKIALNRLFDLLHEALSGICDVEQPFVTRALKQDFIDGGFKGSPKFLLSESEQSNDRQARHVAAKHTNRQLRYQS